MGEINKIHPSLSLTPIILLLLSLSNCVKVVTLFNDLQGGLRWSFYYFWD